MCVEIKQIDNMHNVKHEHSQFSCDSISFDRPFILSMGPQRCATSWLDRYLRQRGDVCIPQHVKEIMYFDKNYDRGTEFYKRHFKIEPQHKCVIEVSTTCFDTAEVPGRVHKTLGGDIKLLCPLRHPVTRSYSLYLHYKRYGQVAGTLQEACEKMPRILTSSHYVEHLEKWQAFFPLETFKFVFQEDLEADKDDFVQNICAYLGIPYVSLDGYTEERFNSTSKSKYPFLAAGAQSTADFLRRYELYGLINMAKSIGLKNLVFGNEQPKEVSAKIAKDDLAWLEEKLLPEVEKLEQLIGPIPHW